MAKPSAPSPRGVSRGVRTGLLLLVVGFVLSVLFTIVSLAEHQFSQASGAGEGPAPLWIVIGSYSSGGVLVLGVVWVLVEVFLRTRGKTRTEDAR